MTNEEIIEHARKALPLPSKVNEERYCIEVVDPLNPFENKFATEGVSRFHRVIFIKKYINYVCIGWRFDQII